ncbi:radical SAM protein [Methanosarcinales archaeon]|nr:MAG: radical SAM protein [Methanosarcinales archaeon]
MNTLMRYPRVSAGIEQARFLIAKKIPVDYDLDAPLSDLWSIHDDAMREFNRVEKIKKPEEKSLLDLKNVIADRILGNCHFCDRRCGVNRKKGKIGYCRIGAVSRYSSEFLHYGEEPKLVPSHTIFLSGCVFSCVYCQNWEISTNPDLGMPILPDDVARIIASRRGLGARNLNFVTPTPHLHTILRILAAMKVNTPVIWNSNMYHSEEAAKLLSGVVDVYLADFKYGNDACAKRYSNADHYWDTVTRNFTGAYDDSEILLRQLVLPGHIECCTQPIIEWVREHIPRVRFNLMFQYRPMYLAYKYPEINRSLTESERTYARKLLAESGICCE